MPPSLTTEAKTLKPWAAEYSGTKSDFMSGRDFFRVGPSDVVDDPESAAVHVFGPHKEEWANLITSAINERSSLLSLVEDMAKALEAFSNLSEVFKHRTVTRPASGDDPIFAWADHRVNDGEALMITVGDLMKAREANARYTEFRLALSAQEGSK